MFILIGSNIYFNHGFKKNNPSQSKREKGKGAEKKWFIFCQIIISRQLWLQPFMTMIYSSEKFLSVPEQKFSWYCLCMIGHLYWDWSWERWDFRAGKYTSQQQDKQSETQSKHVIMSDQILSPNANIIIQLSSYRGWATVFDEKIDIKATFSVWIRQSRNK